MVIIVVTTTEDWLVLDEDGAAADVVLDEGEAGCEAEADDEDGWVWELLEG